MSDVTISAAAGAASFPLLAAFGIDPPSMVCGFMGVIIIQTLIPKQKSGDWLALVAITIGSVLFASLAAPLASPWLLSKLPSDTPHLAAKCAVAGLCGAFAQPLLVLIRRAITKRAEAAMKEESQ